MGPGARRLGGGERCALVRLALRGGSEVEARQLSGEGAAGPSSRRDVSMTLYVYLAALRRPLIVCVARAETIQAGRASL